MKLSKNTLTSFMIVVTVLVGTGLIYLFNPWWTNNAEAAWFDDNWGYRQRIDVTVTSTASDITFLDTLITVDTDDLITAGKLQSSCQDLRFTNQNGKALPYYIDSGCNGNSTKIWVRADLVPKNTTKYTIYMYYGNPSAAAGSDPITMNLYNGLIAYWTMNNTSGTSISDSSVNAFNATLGGTNTLVSGQYANAINNAAGGVGTTYAYGAGSALDFTSSTRPTISFWYKSSTGSQSTRFIEAVASGGWGLEILSGVLKINTFSGATGDFGYTMPTDGAFHHFAVTYDGTNARLYVDGALNTTIAYTAGWTTGAKTLYMLGDASFPTNATLDDLRVYNRVLSLEEVQQIRSQPGSIVTTVPATITPSTSFASEEKGPTPIAYWKFDDAQGTTAGDATTNNLDGSLNGPTWQTEDQCIAGKCLWFDGSNDRVQVTDNTALDFTGDFTISAWILRNAGAGASIVSKTNDSADGGYAMLIGSAGEIYCRTVNGSGHDDSSTALGILPADSTWHQALVVRSGTSCKVYFDGADRTNTVDTHTTMTANNNNLMIGTRPDASTEFWNGKLDDIKIYNFALTAAQVKANYNSRSTADGASQVLGQAVNNQPGALNSGQVGYWKMGEASWTNNCSTTSVTDSSGNGNNGTSCPNGTGISAPSVGKFGNAPDLNGSTQYLSAAHSTSLDITGSITVAGWMKSDNTSGTHYIASKGDFTNSRLWGLLQSNTTIQFFINGSSGYTLLTSDAGSMPDTNWHHVAGVYDGTNMNIYVDGILAKSTAKTGTINSSSVAVLIGTLINNGSNQEFFDGKLDEVRIYNRALSPAEATQLYNFAPGPIGEWKMEEGNGTSTVDTSTNAKTGTLTGSGATWGTGKFGKAVSLSGSAGDYVNVGDDSIYDFGAGDYTLQAWVKRSSTGTNDMIFGKDNSTAGTRQFHLFVISTGVVRLSYFVATDTQVLLDTTDTIDTNWHHIVGERSGNSFNIYIDGKLSASGTTSGTHGTMQSTTAQLQIGRREYSGSTDEFAGSIDEAKIYNYARSAGQVVADMNAGHPAPGSPVGSPLGYWKFDEGALNMCSGGSNDACNSGSQASALDGAFNGNTAYSNSGKFSKAASFDGTGDYIAVTDQTALDITGTMTISAWVNPSANNSFNDIVTKLAGAGTEAYALYAVSGAPKFEVSSNGSATTAVTSSQTMSTGTWYHVAAVYVPSTSLTIYVNGQQTGQNTTSIPSAIFSSTANLNIGSENSGGTAGWNGYIDEVKVYSSALTQSQILLDMNRGSGSVQGALSTSSTAGNDNASTRTAQSGASEYCIPGDSSTCTAPVAEWKMEEKTGSSAFDTSTGGFTGTITGATWVNSKTGMGSALDFDGNDKVENASEVTSSTNVTLTGWAKLDAKDTGGAELVTIGDAVAIELDDDTIPKLLGFFYDGTTWRNTTYTYTAAGTGWHFFAYSVDSTNDSQKLYMDGILVASGTYTGNLSYTGNGSTTRIGTHGNTGTDVDFDGSIDQVRVYSYIRTPAQIAWEYNQGKPVAYWKLDECQGTVANDASINGAGTGSNGNTGTITIGASGSQTTAGTCSTPTDGTGAWYNGRTGKRNYSLSFDGTDDYVQMASGTNYASTEGHSYAAWVYIAGNPGGGSYNWVINNGSGTSLGSSLIVLAADKPAFFYEGGTKVYTTTNTISRNAWHHIVASYDATSTTVTIYIDGRPDSTSSALTSWSGGTSAVRLGAFINDAHYFNGQIDDARIYNYALTAKQVQTVMNEGAVRRGPVTGAP